MKSEKNALQCADVRGELLANFDADSLENISNELKLHLEICPQCQLEFQSLTKLNNGLCRLTKFEPDPTFWINFLPKLRQRMIGIKPAGKRGDFSWIPSLALAVIFLLFLLQSPTRVAPPNWYSAEKVESGWTSSSQWDDNSSDNSYQEQLSLSGAQSLIKSNLTEVEAYLVESLSEDITYVPEDPIESLATMSDQELEVFLEKLKTSSIIKA